MQVNFYDKVDDEKLKFAVIISTYKGEFVFCKHKKRNTLEVPGGHREADEIIEITARRELYEETGAIDFDITPICVYSVIAESNFNGEESFGMLYYANIKLFETELHNEIEKIVIQKDWPTSWTYPLIQPKLMEKAIQKGFI